MGYRRLSKKLAAASPLARNAPSWNVPDKGFWNTSHKRCTKRQVYHPIQVSDLK